ncbi:hypothetical protein ACLOJK_011043 [Asimina triloba]
MPAFGVVLKTCFILLPLLYVWFWCSSSRYDAFPFNASELVVAVWLLVRVEVSGSSGIISIGKSSRVENGSGNAIVEESNGVDIIVEQSNGSSSVVDVTDSSESRGVEERHDHGAFVIRSIKSMGVKEPHASADIISNRKSEGVQQSPLTPFQRILDGGKRQELDSIGVSCTTSNITDICVVDRQVRIDARKMAVHVGVAAHNLPPMLHSICPYTVKYNTCLPGVTPVQVVADHDTMPPACHLNHQVPAIIFTNGGYATNLFHDFNDVLIPLFLTSRAFRSRVVFVVDDFNSNWITKYRPILSHLSAYQPIYASQDNRVHCFPGAVVGLKYHSGFTCNASKTIGGYSIKDFRRFLFDSFRLKEKNGTAKNNPKNKPTLVLISRTTTRRILNEKKLIRLAQRVGFQVSVATPGRVSNLETFAQVLHSCDVLVGMHGAGMENLMFLREGAVLVQVVGLGLEWVAKHYYGDPARAVGINYLKYEATYEESSLSGMYTAEEQVIVDPPSIYQQSYQLAKSIYLDVQNIRVDLKRFRGTLLQAMQLTRTSAS